MRPPTPPKAVWIAIAVMAAVAAIGHRTQGGAPTLPAGTVLVAALTHSISTVDARAGDRVELRTVHPVQLPDGAVIPVGAVIRGHVTRAVSGQGRRAPELLLRFSTIDFAHHRYGIASVTFHVRGRNQPRVGWPARAAGVAVGSGAAIATDGRELMLPAGRRLSVRLTAPAAVPGDSRQVD
ncbi:MAG: hypothetical protein ACREMV_05880 [Gemmatimonadales bacterium]